MVHFAALQVLGVATRNHQNDVKIQILLKEKRQLHRAHKSDPTSESKKGAYVSKCKESCASCKIPGLATRLTRSKAMPTDTI